MKIQRMRKPTQAEIEEFRANVDDLYPLVRVIECAGGVVIGVEGLYEGLDEPNYEAIAPKGYRFMPNDTGTLLGTTLADIKSRVRENELEKVENEEDE